MGCKDIDDRGQPLSAKIPHLAAGLSAQNKNLVAWVGRSRTLPIGFLQIGRPAHPTVEVGKL